MGLSWDERNNAVAVERAALCNAESANFEVLDVRRLSERLDLIGRFDVVMMIEVIEHILDDTRLIQSATACLRLPGGRLLLTTPNINFRAIIPSNNGPFSEVEDGGHIRRGYGERDLRHLSEAAGLTQAEITYCMGVLSQKITGLFHRVSRVHPLAGSALITPLRMIPPVFDKSSNSGYRLPGVLYLSGGNPAYLSRPRSATWPALR